MGRRPGGARLLGGEQVEGRHAVHELLAAGHRPAKAVYLSRAAEPAPVLDEIRSLAGPALRLVAPERLAALARSETHQGVVATARPLAAVELSDLLRVDHCFLVALDGVTDPHNLGAVLRSAVAFGATGAIVASRRAALITPAVAKAAAGAIEHLPIALVSGVPAALERARRAGAWTVGLAVDGATDLDALTVGAEPLVLVVGAEGRGLSRLASERCDVVARIPIDDRSGSLNASVAAAIAMYEIARARSTRSR